MPITFTDDAVTLLTEIMEKQKLNTNEYAIVFRVDNGSLTFNFERDVTGCKSAKNLKYSDDPRVEEDIVIATFKVSDGRSGIIFLGKDEIAKD